MGVVGWVRGTRWAGSVVLSGGSLTVLASAAGLVWNALRDSIVFFSTPTMVAEKNSQPGQRFRLGGLVQSGSLQRGGKLQVKFIVDASESYAMQLTDRALSSSLGVTCIGWKGIVLFLAQDKLKTSGARIGRSRSTLSDASCTLLTARGRYLLDPAPPRPSHWPPRRPAASSSTHHRPPIPRQIHTPSESPCPSSPHCSGSA